MTAPLDNTLDHLADLAAFVERSPSSFHAVAESARRLAAASFTELAEVDGWPTGAGRFFTIRDGAVVAWIMPPSAVPTTPFRIVGAHTDSPGFVLKPRPVTSSQGWLQAGVEVYGGPLLNSWLDRDWSSPGDWCSATARHRWFAPDRCCVFRSLRFTSIVGSTPMAWC